MILIFWQIIAPAYTTYWAFHAFLCNPVDDDKDKVTTEKLWNAAILAQGIYAEA